MKIIKNKSINLCDDCIHHKTEKCPHKRIYNHAIAESCKIFKPKYEEGD